jgi:hypothetical protein
MECSVRYVREEDRFGTVTSSLRPALCFRGRSVIHAVVSDETRVRVLEISPKQYDRAEPLQYHGHEYPIGRMIKTLRTAALAKGITQRAVALLERPEVVDEDTLPPDEPTEDNRDPVRKVEPAGIDSSEAQSPKPEPRRASKRRDPAIVLTEFLFDPGKAPKPAKKAEAKPSDAAKPTLVAQLAAELRMQPQPLRVLLRAAGLRAPYTDLDAMRKAIKK